MFNNFTSASGDELWRTDGTAAGTVQVKDLEPGSASSNPRSFTRLGEYLYFHAYAGSWLWRTDGTTAGTVDVPRPGGGQWFSTSGTLGSFASAVVLQDRMIFRGNGELWQSDGTSNGTGLLFDINPAGASNPTQFTVMGNEVFFVADDGTGRELWKTDGTAAGTVLVRDIAPQGSSSPNGLQVAGFEALFLCDGIDLRGA